VRDFQVGMAFQPMSDAFVAGVVKDSLNMPARVWREVMAEMLSPKSQVELRKIKVPTLILWGDKETVFPRSEQDALLAALPNARLKVYEDTGHAMHWERPERFAKDLQEFMN
jgi:pimeloyl-ACP methyl ester carboxylesterase